MNVGKYKEPFSLCNVVEKYKVAWNFKKVICEYSWNVLSYFSSLWKRQQCNKYTFLSHFPLFFSADVLTWIPALKNIHQIYKIIGIQQLLCALSVSATWGHSHVSFSLFFVYYSISTSWIPRLTSPHKLILSNTHQRKCSNSRGWNYVSCIIQKKVVSSCSAVQRGLPCPLRSVIRELCCTQIELSERLPFSPPFHTKNTQTHRRATVEQSDTYKMEGPGRLLGPVWKLW